MTDWNPSDPDATRVYYDLSAWTIDQQAELASAMAEVELPHAWEGAELMVPEEFEDAADAIIEITEQRLGITGDDDTDGADGDGTDEPEPREPMVLGDEVMTTEYDLGEWDDEDIATATQALTAAGTPFRWEEKVLLVGTEDEEVVETLLDEIESGEFESDSDDVENAVEAAHPPIEVLTSLFLAGERLKKDPLDADGLEQLLAATDVIKPTLPPFGVDPELWKQTCAIADQLTEALAGEDEPDLDDAMDAAEELFDLLRPHV